jgi:hypothetical protein
MKYIQSFLFATICAALLTFSVNASAQTSKPGMVTVVRIQGEARYSSGDNVWHPLTPGKILGEGDVIQSGVDSLVDIVLNDPSARPQITSAVRPPAVDASGAPMKTFNSATEQNVIRLQSDTVLAIDKLTIADTGVDKVTDTELDLRQGKIFGNVKKISATSQFLVKTPTGVAGIRGTTFILGANGDVTVLAGSVVVSHVGANGRVETVVLGAGESFNPDTGQVTHMTLKQLVRQLQQAVAIITAPVGTTITFPNDQTTIYISPYAGRR